MATTETTETMTESEFVEALTALIWHDDDQLVADTTSVSSFAECGMLTTNEGLVVRLADGSEFQLTVVRSR